jgi:hypothetical protein
MALCKSCTSLHVEASDTGGEWRALLLTRPSDFVDVYSEVDNYPEALWVAAETYFKYLGETSDHKLPRGRYASAQELMSRRLPFLMGYALGHVCHFVQIAISKRKLLGYIDGGIVPYARSTSMVKSRCAKDRRPLPAPNATISKRASQPKLEVADWETVRTKLREILDMATERGSGLVQLSNVKRLFRSLFQMELSETALGHTTLTGLLNDTRFRDVCTVQVQGRGHVVVPVPSLASNSMPSNFSISSDAAGDAGELPRSLSIGKESDFPEQTMLPVERTFIHFDLFTPRATLSKAAHRSRSLPAAAGLPQIRKDHSTRANSNTDLEAGELTAASTTAVTVVSSSSSLDECLDLEEAKFSSVEGMSPPYSPFALATPSPRSTADDAQDETTEDVERCAWEATCRALGLKPLDFDPASFDTTRGSGTPEADDEKQDARIQFCIKEPLAYNEDELQGELCSLRTPSPLYDNAVPWRQMHTSKSKAGKAAAWADQLTVDDDMEPAFFRSNTIGFPTHSHAIQPSDPCWPLTPGFRAQQETLVLSLASML